MIPTTIRTKESIKTGLAVASNVSWGCIGGAVGYVQRAAPGDWSGWQETRF